MELFSSGSEEWGPGSMKPGLVSIHGVLTIIITTFNYHHSGKGLKQTPL